VSFKVYKYVCFKNIVCETMCVLYNRNKIVCFIIKQLKVCMCFKIYSIDTVCVCIYIIGV
jgi:hypothetical protein